MYLFVILVTTWMSGGDTYTRLQAYNDVNACTNAGKAVPPGVVWRCAPMIVPEDSANIAIKFP